MWPGVNYRATINDNMLVTVMIETLEGVANAEEIAATAGVDVIIFGNNDLSSFSGWQQNDPRYQDALIKVRNAALKYGKYYGNAGQQYLNGYPSAPIRAWCRTARHGMDGSGPRGGGAGRGAAPAAGGGGAAKRARGSGAGDRPAGWRAANDHRPGRTGQVAGRRLDASHAPHHRRTRHHCVRHDRRTAGPARDPPRPASTPPNRHRLARRSTSRSAPVVTVRTLAASSARPR